MILVSLYDQHDFWLVVATPLKKYYSWDDDFQRMEK